MIHYMYRYVQSLYSRKTFPNPLQPIMERGIVYYVYTSNRCEENPRYLKEVERNSASVKLSDPNAKIAVITNCDIPASTAKLIDVIVPVHNNDIVNTNEKQWQTRMLYNAYLPFNYSFITDTHVFPCDNKAYADIFDQFKASNIDISFSNRVNRISYVFGAAALSKWGRRSFEFWTRTYQLQVQKHIFDDQGPMSIIMNKYQEILFSFRWLSSNYVYASHGITEKGVFKGDSHCYRSSIVVTGPIRWIHGSPDECEKMNGKNNELVNKPRVWFSSGVCNTTGKGNKVILSRSELIYAVNPYEAPKLEWDINYQKKPSRELFWILFTACNIK